MAIRDRTRASFALEKVRQTLEQEEKTEEYKTWLKKLPTHLHVNGLGQTAAFYLASGVGNPKAEICGWLGAWLTEEANVYSAGGTLIEHLTSNRPDGDRLYRRASAEARALSLWLKRFAEAFL